jgi:long-subunit fatty acid transport protein
LQLGAEVAVSPSPAWTLVAQATWKHWSPFPVPIENATAGGTPPPQPGFHDTVVPRLGAEWRLEARPIALALRAGYFFEWSPAPDAALIGTPVSRRANSVAHDDPACLAPPEPEAPALGQLRLF